VVRPLGWDTGGIQAAKSKRTSWHPRAGTRAWWGRTKGSTAGIFLLTESVRGLQALEMGGKSTAALLAPASLHALAGGAGGQARRQCQYFSHHTDRK